jgi:DNA mismatch endonuclease (patch repair protein)
VPRKQRRPFIKALVSPARSKNMAAIRSRDTKPELLTRSFLHARGLRYTLHDRSLPGKPDIVLPRFNTIVFVHGCFWHWHGCSRSIWPKTRRMYWRTKILGNKRRDARVKRRLRNSGWRVLTVWECQTRQQKNLERLTVSIQRAR